MKTLKEFVDPTRMSRDMDIWIEPTRDNAKRTYEALVQFGAPMSERVDVMTSIDAVTFSEAWEKRVQIHWGDIPVSIISLQHLKQNKKATDRDTDKIHLARLEKYGGPSD